MKAKHNKKLSDKILFKLGFKSIDVPKGVASIKIMEIDGFRIEFSTGFWWLADYQGTHTCLKYKHELYDLYFALNRKNIDD